MNTHPWKKVRQTYGFVEDSMKKDEYGKIGFGPVTVFQN